MSKSLDELVLKNGELFDEKSVKYADKEKILESIKNSFAYDDNQPIPGEDVDFQIDEQIENIKDTAIQNLIAKAAIVKAQNESEKLKTAAEKKKERQEERKNFIESMMYQQGEYYYQIYHYIMDGKTKRATRKRIERAYDTKKFSKSGFYFNVPKMRTVRKPNKTENNEPVNVKDIL